MSIVICIIALLSLFLGRGACMSSSSLITMQPVACVFSSCPSSRLSALHGSTVREAHVKLCVWLFFVCLFNNLESFADILPQFLRFGIERHVCTVFFQVQIAFMTTSRTWLAIAQGLTSSTVGCSSPQPLALWVSTNWVVWWLSKNDTGRQQLRHSALPRYEKESAVHFFHK